MTLTSGSVGFITSTLEIESCDMLQVSKNIPFTTTQSMAITYQAYAFTSAPETVNMGSSAIFYGLLLPANLILAPNKCCFLPVTSATLFPNRKFIIDYPPETYMYPDFTFTLANQCTDWLDFYFWYKMDSNPVIPGTNPIYFFDHTYWQSFTSDTDKTPVSEFYNIGTKNYTITVTGTLPNH